MNPSHTLLPVTKKKKIKKKKPPVVAPHNIKFGHHTHSLTFTKHTPKKKKQSPHSYENTYTPENNNNIIKTSSRHLSIFY